MTTPLFAVMGDPIVHSLSPMIHQHFAERCQIALAYEAIQVTAAQFPQALMAFRANGGVGLNLTAPLKACSMAQLADCSERAKLAGAVNTLRWEQDRGWVGDNTDGIGLMRDLGTNLQIVVQHKKVLILGAGGACRGIVRPLQGLRPKLISIASRDITKAQALAELFKPWGKLRAVGYEGLKLAQYDVVINATTAGHSNTLPPLGRQSPLRHTYCIDLNYGLAATPFLEFAQALQARQCADGLGMLVEQAAEAFFFWHQVSPQTTGLREALGHQLNHRR